VYFDYDLAKKTSFNFKKHLNPPLADSQAGMFDLPINLVGQAFLLVIPAKREFNPIVKKHFPHSQPS
jgi:hypothetical protein